MSVTVLVIGAVLSWYFLSQSREVLMEELQKRARSLTKNLAHNSKYGILTEDDVILQELIEGILQEDSVLFVLVADAQGKVLAQQFKESEKTIFTQQSAALAAQHAVALAPHVTDPSFHSHVIDNQGVYHTASPVETAEARLSRSDEQLATAMLLLGEEGSPETMTGPKTVRRGSVQIILSLEKTQANIRKTFATGIGLTLVIILVGILVSSALIGHWLTPVRAMAEAALKIASGDLSQRVAVKSRDEIGVLGTTFNRMAESLERKIVETKTLYEIGQEITAQVAFEPTLHLIVERTRVLLQTEVSLLALRQEESDTFAIQAYSGTAAEALLQIRFKAGDELSRHAVVTATPMMVNDYLQKYRESTFLGAIKKAGVRSVITVPLKTRRAVIGVLAVTSQTPHKFHEEDQQLLSALADQAAIAIENAKLYEQAKQYAGELEAKVEARTRELQQTNKELEAFSYSVSHDLRAPLRGIDGFSQVLLEDYADKLDAEGKSHLQRVRAASQRMAQLIDDMLNLSRVTRSEIHHTTVDLSALVQTIAAELHKTQPERHVTFVIAEGVIANGDARLLRVVLGNLLGNAWKFTGKNTRATIEFGVIQQDGKPAYFVRDDGTGFDMAYADKLYAAFQRLHTVDEFEGTGVGLATVQRIIHRHGGRIRAEGAVGRGATFYFTL